RRCESDQKFRPSPRWASSAACTFSNTVSFGKMLVRWNERPMPSRQMRCGATPVMSRPSTTTRPAVGCRGPVIRLDNVDLPAPFGPMTAAIWPSGTAMLTSDTARKPPNDLVRPCTSSIGGLPDAAPQPAESRHQPADDAARKREQQDEQDEPEH